MDEISKLKTYFGADDGAYEDMDKERAKQAWGEREAWRVLQDENARLKAALQEIAAIPVPLKSINQMSNEAYVILAGGYCSGVLKCQKIAGKALEGKS